MSRAPLGYFCSACGIVHADSAPIVGPHALSVQQVRMTRYILELRVAGDRVLGFVEICALLGVDCLDPKGVTTPLTPAAAGSIGAGALPEKLLQ